MSGYKQRKNRLLNEFLTLGSEREERAEIQLDAARHAVLSTCALRGVSQKRMGLSSTGFSRMAFLNLARGNSIDLRVLIAMFNHLGIVFTVEGVQIASIDQVRDLLVTRRRERGISREVIAQLVGMAGGSSLGYFEVEKGSISARWAFEIMDVLELRAHISEQQVNTA